MIPLRAGWIPSHSEGRQLGCPRLRSSAKLTGTPASRLAVAIARSLIEESPMNERVLRARHLCIACKLRSFSLQPCGVTRRAPQSTSADTIWCEKEHGHSVFIAQVAFAY